MPAVHLISGLPCSGKTTYATALRHARNGVLFSLDYWLITLHGQYSINAIGHEEHVRRVITCRRMIRDVARHFLVRGSEVILDDGFFLREHRVQQIAFFDSIAPDVVGGIQTKTHVVQVPVDILRARLEHRNADLPQYNFAVNVGLIEQFSAMYDQPSLDEGAEVLLVDGTAAEVDRRLSDS